MHKMNRRNFIALTSSAALAAMTPRELFGSEETSASKKKGFGVTAGADGKWRERIKELRANWFYTWGAHMPDKVPEGTQFVPMMWGGFGDKGQETLDKIKQLGKDKKISYLLGFNEPDHKDQSNMSVAKVLELWPKLMAVGLPLGSPACAHPDSDWMKQFMDEVDKRKLRVDYIAAHNYGGPSPEALLKRLQDVHLLFGKRPIVLTEFAVGDWDAKAPDQNRYPPKKVAQFMKAVLPLLEKADYVHGYAWYSAPTKSSPLGTSALYDGAGQLTDLGKIYAAF